MKALTLWQPWASCMVHGPKRIENRTWAPPDSLVGKRIALHAGKHWDRDGAEFCEDRGFRLGKPEAPLGFLIGSAIIERVFHEQDVFTGDWETCGFCDGEGFTISCVDDMCHGAGRCIHGDGEAHCRPCGGSGEIQLLGDDFPFDQKTWFFGPFGWLLADMRSCTPFEIKGWQGLWNLPPEAERHVQRSLETVEMSLSIRDLKLSVKSGGVSKRGGAE